MDEQERQAEAVRIFRETMAGGGTEEQATRASRMFLEGQGADQAATVEPDRPGFLSRFRAALSSQGERPDEQLLAPEEAARTAQGLLGATLQGVSFGASEELGAAFRSIPALVPGGETPQAAFARNLAQATAGLEEFREEHPVVSTLGTVGGAVAQGVALAPLLPAKLTGAGLLGLGAAEGGLTAAGTTEGGVVERLEALPGGVAAGAAGAGAGLGLGRLLGAAGRKTLDFLNLRPATEEIPGVAGMASRAESKLSGVLPKDLTEATARIARSDRPLSVLDVDENVRSLARAARGVQGESRESLAKFLGGRVEGQEQRVLDDALRLTGLGERASIVESSQAIIKRRSEAFAPMYEAAYRESVPSEIMGDIDLLADDVFREAYEGGRRAAARNGVALPTVEEIAEGAPIPVEGIDLMKSNVQEVARRGLEGGRRVFGREASGINNQLNSLLDRVDEAVPVYGQARMGFAGESRMLDALEQGRDLWKLDPTEARQIIDALPDGEREMFVRGGFESLAARVEDASATFDITARRPLAPKTRDRQRLRLLFPNDDAFDEFVAGLTDEAQIAATRRFVEGGSQTADKLAGLAEFAGVDIGDIAALTSGNLPSLITRMAQRTVLGGQTRFMGRLGEELTPSFTATGEDAVIVLDRIARLRQGVGRELSVRDAAIAVGAGSAAGAAVGRNREQRR